MKCCTKCLLPFPLTNFYKHKGRKDGHDELCKPCRTIVNTASRSQRKDVWNANRRILRKTSTHTKDVQRSWRTRNKDRINEDLRNSSHRQEWRKDYKLKNKEHIAEVEATRYTKMVPVIPIKKECAKCHDTKPTREFSPSLQHTDGLKSYCKDCHSKDSVIHHREHPESMSAASAKHKAKTRGANNLDRITHIALAERDGWSCHLCHKKVTKKNWSIDHLIPISQGGQHIWENVALAHILCNVRRGAGRIPAQLRLLA